MRFLLSVAALPLVLLGAAPQGEYVNPVVVVFPLSASGSATRTGAGAAVAALLANRLAQLGGLTVKPAPPDTKLADYLSAAIGEGADYYVTGFMAPVGNEESIILQVVSTTTGTIIYSTSTMAQTYGDAVGNAQEVSQAILSYAGRALASLDAPPPPSPSPTPGGKNAASFNLSKLFAHRSATRAPRTSGSAAPTTPSPKSVAQRGSRRKSRTVALATVAPVTALVVTTAGDASDAQRLRATEALVAALSKAGVPSASLPVTEQTVSAHAKQLCAANPGTATFYAAKLALTHDAKGKPGILYDVTAYDCTGAVLRQQHLSETASKRGGIDAAIAAAATQAAGMLTRDTKT